MGKSAISLAIFNGIDPIDKAEKARTRKSLEMPEPVLQFTRRPSCGKTSLRIKSRAIKQQLDMKAHIRTVP